MRARLLSYVRLGRLAGFVALGGALVAAAAVQFAHETVGVRASASEPSSQNDPLALELARCQTIGMAAQDDAGCAAVWAANRRRFFRVRPPAQPTQLAPISSTPRTGSR